ncbi:insulin-like 3 (Leydig cell) [Lampris incognitus]|uniref:insulin-like 3 (Leydig cell) n=1 Tax=Lampris incognitus TaxID=2546036 RepID=UPI0024B5FD6D|nr:insulin-like 3 (Leydig cell) [Lampris incognitus]
MSHTRFLVFLMALLAAKVCVIHGQERIKMCGRDLIRLVISSCGNSRLSRGPPEQLHGKSHEDQGISTEEQRGRAAETSGGPSQSDGEMELSLASHWDPLSNPMRHAVERISDICCEKGCSMRELIQFC